MKSFQWKRKVGENVCKSTIEKFVSECKDDSNVALQPAAKKPKSNCAEDNETKFKRLYEEGCILAEEERYWEALRKWDEALILDSQNEKLYELKSQAFLELHELIPAVEAAEKVVQLKPTWWVGYQTLGRAQMSLGDVQMAIKNFSKSCHLNPEVKELWIEDLGWACSLLSRLKTDENLKLKMEIKDEKIDNLLRWSEKISKFKS